MYTIKKNYNYNFVLKIQLIYINIHKKLDKGIIESKRRHISYRKMVYVGLKTQNKPYNHNVT